MPWIINAVGAAFIGFAIGDCGDMALTYFQDSYQLMILARCRHTNPEYSLTIALLQILGPALTAVEFVRNIIATALVFAASPWMASMGVYDMFVLLGCVAVAIAPTCVPLMIWGRRLRAKLAAKCNYFIGQQYQSRGSLRTGAWSFVRSNSNRT